MELLIVFACVALWWWLRTLAARVSTLEEMVQSLRLGTPKNSSQKKSAEALVADVPMAPNTVQSGVYVFQNIPTASPYPTEPTSVDRFIAWVKQDFLVKLGGLLLVLAFGWFVSYAFANDWIGPVGRITLGLFAGVAFMTLGVWRITTHVYQGGIFTVLGSTIVILTTFAAQEIYDMFLPYVALTIMFASVVFVAFVSVRYNRNTLALSGLLLGAMVPFLIGGYDLSVIEHFVYLMVLVVGSLWVVYLRGWSNLTALALFITYGYSIPYLANSYGIQSGDTDVALLFAFLFTALFFVANIVGLVCNESKKNRLPQLGTAFGTSIYLFMWVSGVAEPEWHSLLFGVWMLVFSVGGYLVFRATSNTFAFYIYAATSFALLVAATAAELDGPAFLLVLTTEIAAIALLGALLFPGKRSMAYLSLLFAIPVLLSTESIWASSWSTGVLHSDLVVLLYIGAVCAGVGYTYLKEHTNITETTDTFSTLGSGLITVSVLYGLTLIWLILHAGTQTLSPYGYALYEQSIAYQQATMYALIIYALIGITAYIGGSRAQHQAVRWGGGILLALVVGRLLFVEIWLMDEIPRIITFFAVGILFISTAFIRHHRKSSPSLPTENLSS